MMLSNPDHIREAIAQIIAADDDNEDTYLIGDLTLVAEMVGPDSKTYLFHVSSEDITVWKERGMLMYRLDMLTGQAVVAEGER